MPTSDPRALNQAAHAAAQSGDYARAAATAEQAAKLFRSAGDRAGEASAMNNLGVALTYEGVYDRAAEALRLAGNLSTDLHDDEAIAEQLTNLANVDFYRSHYNAALLGYEQALDVVSRAGNTSWSDRRRSIIRTNMAALRLKLGDEQSALEIYRSIAGDSSLEGNERAQMLVNLGIVYRRLGDPIKALEQYDLAGRLFAEDRHLDGELGALKNRGIVLALDLGEVKQATGVFSAALSIATRAQAQREALQARLYRGEAAYRDQDYRAAAIDFTQSLTEAQRLRLPEDEWKALYGLARMALRQQREADATTLLTQAIGIIEAIRGGLNLHALKRDFFADKRDVYDALISIYVKRNDVEQAFAWMERSRARTFQDRIAQRSSTPALKELQQVLQPDAMVLEFWDCRRGAAVIAITQNARKLRVVDRAITPAAVAIPELWSGAGSVVVVPDGRFSGVPFETMRSGARLLIEQSAVSYAPAAALLLRASGNVHSRNLPWKPQLAVFADPHYEVDRLGRTANRLPATRQEAANVAAATPGRTWLFLGGENRRDAFTRVQTPLIHVASHAAADNSSPDRSRILFSAPSGRSEPDYLFLKDVYGLDLRNVQLITLSACDTETGKQIGGEGTETFSRAFLSAGARGVITTLWKVDDQAAATFMSDFYQRLRTGKSIPNALRETKLSLLRSQSPYADPRHWSAFVYTGDPQLVIPQPIIWPWTTAATSLVALAGIVIFRRNHHHSRSK